MQVYPHIVPEVISVRRTRVLLPTSFSYHVTVTTLWFAKTSR